MEKTHSTESQQSHNKHLFPSVHSETKFLSGSYKQVNKDQDMSYIISDYILDTYSDFEEVMVHNMSDLNYIELVIETVDSIESNN